MNGDFDVARLPEMLVTLLTDPGSNLEAALVLYAIIGITLLMVLIVAIMIIMATSDDEEVEAVGSEASGPGRMPGTTVPATTGPQKPRDPRAPLVTFGVTLAIVAAVWVAAGYTTAHSAICTGCHVVTPHDVAEVDRDPHAAVSCVACHEPGGLVGRYTADMPSRVLHFIDGVVDPRVQEDYGRVRQAACTSCHAVDVVGIAFDELRGISMSHAEPLEASARCLDCHRMQDGVVGAHNAGMNPCLRCHDSLTASSECSTCHDEDAAVAARVRTDSLARVQIPEVSCSGCHDEVRQCDPCHGLRLPHTQEFMVYAHSRSAAVDIWYNDGRGCQGSDCHTPVRRPCAQSGCHGSLIGEGHGAGMADAHQNASSERCNTCHQRWAYSPARDFCLDLCHAPAAIEYSPR